MSDPAWSELMQSVKAERTAAAKKRKRKKNPGRKAHVPATGAPVNMNDTVQVTLRARHTIDGYVFGPGIVQVPLFLRDQIVHQDGVAVAYDDSFMAAKNGMSRETLVLGQGRTGAHRLMELPAGTFDAGELPAIPFGQVSGKSLDFSTFQSR